jgi:hypothetical protein
MIMLKFNLLMLLIGFPRVGTNGDYPTQRERLEQLGEFSLLDESGQTYTVEISDNLEDDVCKLALFDADEEIDSVTINRWKDTEGMDVSSNRFLKLTYRVAVGSGEGASLTRIFSVRQKRLTENLVLTTRRTSDHLNEYLFAPDSIQADFRDSSYEASYGANLLIEEIGKDHTAWEQQFALSIRESSSVRYPYDTPRNNQWQNNHTLNFDDVEGIFYNGQINLDGTYFVFADQQSDTTIIMNGDWEIGVTRLVLKNENVKGVFLADRRYVFIKGRWYEQRASNLFQKYDQ